MSCVVPVCNAPEVLAALRGKGIELWLANGVVRYRAPKGSLTATEIEQLRACKADIVTLLDTGEHSAKPCDGVGASRPSRARLGYSQLSRWHMLQEGEVPSIRQVATATRLCGSLDVAALRQSLEALQRRHDSLRTRIVVCDGVPMQEIVAPSAGALRTDDLSRLSGEAQTVQLDRIIDDMILRPVDIAKESLFAVGLVRFSEQEHVLVIALHHLISDEFSTNIFLRDLFAIYFATMQARTPSLPVIPLQYSGYAERQWQSQEALVAKHGAFWRDQLAALGRLHFPADDATATAGQTGWAMVPFKVDSQLKEQLQQWSRQRLTTLTMAVLTAYTAVMLRWCQASDAVLLFQSNARVDPDIQNTIGFFSSVLYLRAALRPQDSFDTLLRRLTTEYCRAYDSADFSYVAAQIPRPEFTRNSVFNWVPRGSMLDSVELPPSQEALSLTPIPFEHPMLGSMELDQEPGVLCFDTEHGVTAGVYFSRRRLCAATMARFGRNLLAFLQTQVSHPDARVSELPWVP